jgi:DNA-binding GntR family transcriptional regulator
MNTIKPPTSSEAAVLDVLVQSVYQSIKDSILSNRLRPGNKLTHQGLAESLGVSRTPVRESLERLYQEGYVTRIANRGYFVAEIDAQEVRELYQTREALETYSLQLVLRTGIPAAAMKRLNGINARYKALCMENLSRERLLVDREFHLTLAEQCGNNHLRRTLAGIFDRLILKRRVEGFHDLRGIAPYEDHVRILEAIAAGDEKAAQKLLRSHIEGACTRFMHYLDGSSPAGAGRASPA